MGNRSGRGSDRKSVTRHKDSLYKKSKIIDEYQYEEKRKDFFSYKLLLLESGKSTVVTQIMILYGSKSWTPEQLKQYSDHVSANTIEAMHQILLNSEGLKERFPGCAIPASLQSEKHYVLEHTERMPLNKELLENWGKLWSCPAVQETHKHSAEFQTLDNAEYFFKRLADIVALGEEYVPTIDDVLRTRVRTFGVIEKSFTIDQKLFTIIDVGGQRSQRKKWVHCFEGVTSVIYVMSLSEFDQKCMEDDTTNRLDEAMELFEYVSNCKSLRNASLILFLNKADLLEEKLRHVEFKEFRPDFTGENTVDDVCAYIQKKALEQQKTQDSREIFPHMTTATNTESVKVVFEAVKSALIKNELSGDGLLM